MFKMNVYEEIPNNVIFSRTYKHLQFAMMDIIPLCIIVGGSYIEITNCNTNLVVVTSKVYTKNRG